MFKNISLSLSGLVFAIVIAAVYLKKKKYNSVENNIYRMLITLTIGLLISEMFCIIIISYRDAIPIITEIICRLFLVGTAAWFILLIGYMKAFLTPEKYSSVKDVFNEKPMIILLIISTILFIISCFFKITYTSGTTEVYNVIGGPAVFAVYVIFFISLYLIGKVLSKNLNRFTLIKRLPMLLYLVLFGIMKLFQYFYTNLSDVGFLFSFAIVAMYFTIENQDIMLVNELEVARKNAETADESKTTFLSKMSHEIRTPLNAIVGLSENMVNKDTLVEIDTINDIKNIYSSGQNLLELINNIIVYSNIEADQEQIENSEYTISNLIFRIYEYAVPRLNNSDVELLIKAEDSLVTKYIGDKSKIYRIIINVFDKAIELIPEGKIIISISDVLKDNNHELKIEIKCIGEKPKEEHINIIKNQLEDNEESNLTLQSVGLSTLIAKKLSNMIDAKIEVSNNENIDFIITIPQKHCSEEKIIAYTFDSKDINNLKNNISIFKCSNKRVLVVDDDRLNLKVIEKLLKLYDIETELLTSGKECINRVKQKEKYDLILLDHLIPGMDGIEIIKALKKINSIESVPIVAMTKDLKEKQKYKEAGFNSYILKPINIEAISNLVSQYLK